MNTYTWACAISTCELRFVILHDNMQSFVNVDTSDRVRANTVPMAVPRTGTRLATGSRMEFKASNLTQATKTWTRTQASAGIKLLNLSGLGLIGAALGEVRACQTSAVRSR